MKTEQMIFEEVESLIDKVGLYNVLEILNMVCLEKADHLESNWEDTHAAKFWKRAGKCIETVAHKQAIQAL